MAAKKRESSHDKKKLKVLTLLGQGFGLSEIADRFCVSSRTIETHLRKKLGVKPNRELTRLAIQDLHAV